MPEKTSSVDDCSIQSAQNGSDGRCLQRPNCRHRNHAARAYRRDVRIDGLNMSGKIIKTGHIWWQSIQGTVSSYSSTVSIQNCFRAVRVPTLSEPV